MKTPQKILVQTVPGALAAEEDRTALQRFRELTQSLNKVTQIHHLLVDGERDRNNTRLIVRGAAQMDVTVSATHIGTILVSGCAGMILAFVIFIPVFFLFVQKHPWIVFVWPVFGMVVVVCSVFAGVCIADKWRS